MTTAMWCSIDIVMLQPQQGGLHMHGTACLSAEEMHALDQVHECAVENGICMRINKHFSNIHGARASKLSDIFRTSQLITNAVHVKSSQCGLSFGLFV